jgi:arylsulfatase A
MPDTQRSCLANLRLAALWAALWAALMAFSVSAFGQETTARPNVILIMADDLGYETIGANGGTSYRTPTLDKLAAGGVRFDHCYVQPLCTPTRVQLMTGAYNVRNYVTFGQMDAGLRTFGNLFKSAGYVTGITGKWQLGQAADLPKKFGFDEHCLWQHTRRPPRYANPGLEINGVEKDFSNGEYGPDLVNEYARDFVTRHKDKPFFLYYPMILTHSPYQPTPDSKTWDPQAKGEMVNQRAEHFGDMVEYMDKLIGKLVATLDEQKIRDNTLLIFIGDNGTGKGTRSMMGDRVVIGGKGSTTTAGMHVPCIVSWPAVIQSGRVCHDLIDSTDFLPTICDAASIKLPAQPIVDGHSFLPQLRGESGHPREWVYCWYSPRGEPLREMAFDQRFKLYRTGEFFDLVADPDEAKPLRVADLKQQSAITAARRLQAALDQFKNARPDTLPKRTPAGANPENSQKKAKKKAAKNQANT